MVNCRCGALRGVLSEPKGANHCICYCKDCQAFAHFLGQAELILDPAGGTIVIQTTSANLTLTQGESKLACVRLREDGMLRWYTSCCMTPIGNTLPSVQFAFVGLVRNCLESGGEPLNSSFGPVRMWVNTQSAKSFVKPRPFATLTGTLRIAGMLLRARFNGSYRRTPFFSPVTGVPVVQPRILTDDERQRLYAAVNAGSEPR